MAVKVMKIGGSMAIVIPNVMAKDMGLAPGVPMDISRNRDTITLRKQSRRTRRPLDEITAQIDSKSYERRRLNDLDVVRVGREV
jgi:antitoxin component of MazEF toxin-antitoxin module